MIYVPARAFLHLFTSEEQLQALRNVVRHLAEDGIFAGNIFFPNVRLLHERQNGPPPQVPSYEFTNPETGNRVRTWEIPTIDTWEQRIRLINRLEEEDPSGEVVRIVNRELSLTYLWPRELEHLFARAGLTITEYYEDFEGTPFGPGSGEQVWVAKRA
jgi:hypothetical protein